MKTNILLLSQWRLYRRNNWKNVIFDKVLEHTGMKKKIK
jgi:hypothetical protein